MRPMESYGITRRRGFVPASDPLQRLPESCAIVDRVSSELAWHMKQQSLGKAISDIGHLDIDLLNGRPERERLFLALCVLANAWIWGQAEPNLRIPAPLAGPMVKLASILDRKATLTYASMAFFNWEKTDPEGQVCAENTNLLCGFLGTRDETWFVTSALHLEVACAPLLATLYDAVVLSLHEDTDGLQQQLASLAEQMHIMTDAVLKVREQCDPVVFYNHVRPFFAGWPSPGVFYEGVSETPRILAGASAAQSPLVQAFDAALGIRHTGNTAAFLDSMTPYMMAEHRRFIRDVRSASGIRDMVACSGSVEMRSSYNFITEQLNEFRRRHFHLVTDYVTKPSRQTTSTGTGGSFYSEILRDAGTATKNACLPAHKAI